MLPLSHATLRGRRLPSIVKMTEKYSGTHGIDYAVRRYASLTCHLHTPMHVVELLGIDAWLLSPKPFKNNVVQRFGGRPVPIGPCAGTFRGSNPRAPENLKWQGSLSLSPIDDLEQHAPSKHFGFQVCCVFLPLWRIADLEPGFAALAFGRVIGSQSTTDGSVHHREAVICESLIIHLLSYKKAVAGIPSDGSTQYA